MTAFDLPSGPRLLVQTDLLPIQGSRFQPTGFPDIGAGTYSVPDRGEHLLVESAQSVANRLEATCWDEASNELIGPAAGLSYVQVNDSNGAFLTSSILEAHRLNSVYIEKTDFFEKVLKPAIGYDAKKPPDRTKFIAALARFDVNCLLHGVFLESIAGVLRVPRALSGFIEAEGIERVSSGGVKNDRVRASTDEEGGKAADGFGNVPFHRTEYVAERITAFFNVDLEQLRSYRLGPEMQRLLFGLALFKIQRFLATGLRLRTACDLAAGELTVRAPTGFTVPSLNEVTESLPGLIKAASSHFASPTTTIAIFSSDKKGKK